METHKIDLKLVGTKSRPKHELYKLCNNECKSYLPPYKYWTTDFIADVIDGLKR